MKLFKKYKEDMIKIQEAQERYYEERFNRIGEKIEKILGKRVRGFFNKLVSK
jgi:heme-degrading monooxygenase HmoA